jgi:hypothetical protein
MHRSTVKKSSKETWLFIIEGLVGILSLFINLIFNYIHSVIFIRRHSPRFWSRLITKILCFISSYIPSVGKTSLGCPAEKLNSGLLACRRTTNPATPHPLNELRCTLTDLRRILMSLPHSTELHPHPVCIF